MKGDYLMPRGVIKRLIRGRGYGFIEADGGGKDIFFYRTALGGEDYWIDFDSLSEGLRVQFEIGTGGDDNRLRAIKVKLTLTTNPFNTCRFKKPPLNAKLL